MIGRPVILAAALVVGLGLPACSGSNDSATPSSAGTPSSTAPTTTTTTEPSATAVPEAPGDEGFAARDPFEPQG